jgi:hypothetical protein
VLLSYGTSIARGIVGARIVDRRWRIVDRGRVVNGRGCVNHGWPDEHTTPPAPATMPAWAAVPTSIRAAMPTAAMPTAAMPTATVPSAAPAPVPVGMGRRSGKQRGGCKNRHNSRSADQPEHDFHDQLLRCSARIIRPNCGDVVTAIEGSGDRLGEGELRRATRAGGLRDAAFQPVRALRSTRRHTTKLQT